MPKVPFLALTVSAVVGLLLTGCGSEPAQDLDDTVLAGIVAAGRSDGDLDLISTTHFDWQKAVIVCPGDDPTDVAEAAGTDGPAQGELPSTVDVGTGHLVFVNDDEVAQVADLRLAQADVCSEDLSITNRVLSPGASLHVARGTGDGWVVTRG
ncbi:hypothetical protein EQW78_13245 [Oerskovia turbata]|uniref:Lipoprotein n=1 Tax=Oerskovia turbata TaxID=1713 RepID=A0A4Q1KTF7_9CELL|nr:hypothetical protein [Oerskovia turbata]RXR25360.1 hypothetical protein EQW73_10940 [Oerskovia turbata]RXR32699.1 hypothetical protein EQW78_13245 [Oerskovia turbata]TGJ95625.1 hypothetical protein DLJ96_13945 [Actinotalea fermentans ATCC 43279 = JCM 9966 = DSM 3133]